MFWRNLAAGTSLNGRNDISEFEMFRELDSISCVRWYLLSQKHVERIREEYLVDLRKGYLPINADNDDILN